MQPASFHVRSLCGAGTSRWLTAVAGLALLVACSTSRVSAQAVADAQRVYKAVGGPTEPRVPIHWNRYYDYGQVSGILRNLVAAYPDFAKLESIGKSYEGRDMWVITVTDFGTGDSHSKPGFWIDGAIHANEIQATEVCLYTAWFLLEMQGENDTIREMLRRRVFFILPMMSPDSRDAHFYRPNSTNSPRSGQRPVDDDRDGLVNEDGPNDLDGDGHITQMRIPDPNGRHKPHPKYPNLLVPVEEGETGQYTLLGQEGYDVDGDGAVNEDGDGYYDPNRDWPWNWQPGYVQGGAFRYPFSLIENRHVADFIRRHPNIAGAQNYHNTGGMVLRGPGSKQDSYESADVRVYDAIGKTGERILPGYRYMNVADDLYEVWGGSVDWFHQMLGVFTFTNELFTPYLYFHKSEGGFSARGETTHEFDALLLFGDGLVPWKEVDHPQYGRVEVGGLKKNWGRQPPAFMLQEECHRNMAFTLYHADQMPLVAVNEVSVKPLGNELSEITAVVRNERLTPTHAAVDVRRKITRPDHVTIAGEGIEVALGQYSSDLLMRRATRQESNPAQVAIPNLPGNSTTYVRWIVRGQGPVTVTVDSIKGGRASRDAVIE